MYNFSSLHTRIINDFHSMRSGVDTLYQHGPRMFLRCTSPTLNIFLDHHHFDPLFSSNPNLTLLAVGWQNIVHLGIWS